MTTTTSTPWEWDCTDMNLNYEYSGELKLYRALIHDNCRSGDDRIQVRVMPYMADISGDEESNLPKYPPFFKGRTVRGYTEKDAASDGKNPTSVYVLANQDFTVGYVLDAVNEFNGALTGALRNSWDYQNSKSILQRAGCLPTGFKYQDLIVNMNEAGTMIDITSYKSAFRIIMTNAGDIFCIQANRIFMMARSGATTGAMASYIDIKPHKIEIKAPLLDLSKSDAVVLGHRGLNLLGTYAEDPFPCAGNNLTPCKTIKV